MNLSVVIFGAGRLGSALGKELFKQNIEVLVIDRDYERINQIAPFVTTAVQCDLSDQSEVKALGLTNFDVSVITIGSDLESSIIATMIAKDSKIPRVIAKASSEMHSRILKKLGADQVLFPEIDLGERLARSISGKNFFEYIHLSEKYSILEVAPSEKWLGKSLTELDFRKNYHLNVVAIRRGDDLIISHLNMEKIQAKDQLLLVGETAEIDRIKNIK